MALEDNFELVKISKVRSSSNDKDSKAENAIDGNADTKWSAKGKDQFLEIDLGEPQAVSGIAVKWYEGDLRRQQYTIYSSDKGGDDSADELDEAGNPKPSQWRRIGTVISSGSANNEYEENMFGGTPLNMQFLKIVGEGNDLNSFTSIVDLKVLGARKQTEVEQPAAAAATAQASGDNTKGASVKQDTQVTKAKGK